MSNQKTLSIIKPDAVKAGHVDSINLMIENSGLKILEKKELQLSKEEAQKFYSVHSDKPFYEELCKFMTSGTIIVQILEGENAVSKNRELMGATDPLKAEAGTLRKMYGISIDKNSVHGSDSVENAKIEIDFFFK